MTLLVDLIVSVCCIVVTLSISQFLREFARNQWHKGGLGRLVFLEFVATFEMVAIAWETTIIFGFGGIRLYSVFLFSIWFWRTQNWREVAASPVVALEDWALRRLSLIELVLAVSAQVAGGFMAYKYFNALYWSLGLSDAHNSQVHEGFSECKSAINAIPTVAMLCEAAGIFVYIAAVNLISKVKSLNPVAGLLKALIGTSIVLLAFDISGGFYSPVLASAMQYGCSGSTVLEHLQVYWLGNALGTLAAYHFDQFLSSTFSKAKQPQKLD